MCATGFSGAAPLCGACWQGPRRARPASPGRSPTRLVWLGSFLCACGMMEIEGVVMGGLDSMELDRQP